MMLSSRTMSGKPVSGDNMSANFAGMSKNQLYDIMCQMKQLIDQNQQQARQILVQNPLLTRALFQAQIMLGMLQTPQAVSSNQPLVSQNPQPTQLAPQPVVQANLPPKGPVGFPDQPSVQAQIPVRQVKNQAAPTIHDTAPDFTIPSPSISSQIPHMSQQAGGNLNIQMPQKPPHAAQVTNVPSSGYYPTSQQSSHQSQLPTASNLFSTGNMLHPSMQPPLPPQPRPTSQPNYLHQPSQQMGSGFHHSNAPQMHHPQSSFHPSKLPSSVGPPFVHGQASPQLNQQQPHSLYQGGNSRFRPDMSSSVGNPMQVERGMPWAPAIPENPSTLAGPPPISINPMAPGNQAPRPPPMTPEMEKALLQQVMSLTPEQINLLPPDQRQQVHQLQQMLRQ